jgi:hypothetical protein
MSNPILLPCDGCGQLADSAHISRRLERLAWATRFRPLHIQSLILGGIAPKLNSDFLYSPHETFHGEASSILKAVQLTTEGKSPEAVLAEFQKLGLMLTHILECPLDASASDSEAHSLLEKQLPATLARIRRSLKPKRLLLISRELQPHADKFHQANLPCPVFPSATTTFLLSLTPTESDLQAFRMALAISNAPAV